MVKPHGGTIPSSAKVINPAYKPGLAVSTDDQDGTSTVKLFMPADHLPSEDGEGQPSIVMAGFSFRFYEGIDEIRSTLRTDRFGAEMVSQTEESRKALLHLGRIAESAELVANSSLTLVDVLGENSAELVKTHLNQILLRHGFTITVPDDDVTKTRSGGDILTARDQADPDRNQLTVSAAAMGWIAGSSGPAHQTLHDYVLTTTDNIPPSDQES